MEIKVFQTQAVVLGMVAGLALVGDAHASLIRPGTHGAVVGVRGAKVRAEGTRG